MRIGFAEAGRAGYPRPAIAFAPVMPFGERQGRGSEIQRLIFDQMAGITGIGNVEGEVRRIQPFRDRCGEIKDMGRCFGGEIEIAAAAGAEIALDRKSTRRTPVTQ